ncbi:MAG TPA: hypothetical protein VK210_16690 [Terriglobia bacterium]|nr:hypothetical protein [Terriglobia bacterium]
MTTRRIALVILTLLISSNRILASGSVGIYAIVDKVVFEPNDKPPERIKVWGVFSFAGPPGLPMDAPFRGYMYFKLPADQTRTAALKEWMDLRTVAGTGQPIAFGKWDVSYYGIVPGQPAVNAYALRAPNPKQIEVLLAHKDADSGVVPITYSTNAGIVSLSSNNDAKMVAQLRNALKH